jgi:hypothetical protein
MAAARFRGQIVVDEVPYDVVLSVLATYRHR